MKGEFRSSNVEVGTRHLTPALSPNEAEREKSPSEEGFITKEVVAERLSVTPETVRRWASAGKLPSHHFGRRLRFKWSEVVAAVAAPQANMTKGTKETNELA